MALTALWLPRRDAAPEPTEVADAMKLVGEAHHLLDRVADGCLLAVGAARISDMMMRAQLLAGADDVVAVRVAEVLVRRFRVEGGAPGNADARADDPRGGPLLAEPEAILRAPLESPALGPALVEHWIARATHGWIHLARGELGPAEKLLAEAAAGVTRLAEGGEALFEGGPHQGLAELYRRSDRPEEAAETLQRAADLDVARSPARLEAALAALRVGEIETALRYGLGAHAAASGALELVRARTLLHALGKLRRTWDERGSLPEPWAEITEKTRKAIAGAAAASRRPGSRACDGAVADPSRRELVADRVEEVCEALVGHYVAGDVEVVADVARSLLAAVDGEAGSWLVRDRAPLRLLAAYSSVSGGRPHEASDVLDDLGGEARWRASANVGRAYAASLRGSFESVASLTSEALEEGGRRLADGEPVAPVELLAYRIACLTMSRAHAREGRVEEARSLLLKAIEQFPKDAEAQQLLTKLQPGP